MNRIIDFGNGFGKITDVNNPDFKRIAKKGYNLKVKGDNVIGDIGNLETLQTVMAYQN
ncbi:MAG: hypothetical protein JSV92_00520 [archaeon]|nr:MAG: hypothetical protein JSV92_00520 [archaeon]